MKKNSMIKITMVLSLLISIVLSCKDGNIGVVGKKSMKELKNELRLMEIDSIMTLIEYNGSIDPSLAGLIFQGTYNAHVNFVLKNNACVARMKDITFTIDFISQTKSKIGEKQITFYEYIEPNNSITVKERIEIPDQTAKLEFRLLKVIGE